VPEDRFGDLGADRPKSAAERFQELDERDPEPQDRKPGPPRPTGTRYGWVVGVAFIIVIIVAGANALRNSGEGFRGVPPGKQLPRFAAPLAIGGPGDKDANVQTKESGGIPAACNVHGPGVLNICELERKGPVVITFVANASRGCEKQLDRVERVRREFPQVQWVGIVSRRKQKDVVKLIEEHHWGFPIALDKDAQLFNFYGVGDCPTTVFAYRGGKVRRSKLGELSEAELRAEARGLLRPPPAQ
jgi:AhpC/TSA family protein